MKKITLFTFLLLSLHTFSQENISEGIVVQKQSLSSTNEQMNTQLAMLGDMQTITYFKANKSRSEMSNPMAGETTTIMDNDKKEMLILINNAQLGKKYAIKSLTPSEESLKNIPNINAKEVSLRIQQHMNGSWNRYPLIWKLLVLKQWLNKNGKSYSIR